MSDRSIVTVLGAGASASCGYPLANELFPRLEEFGRTFGEDRRLIRAAIEHVVAEAGRLGLFDSRRSCPT